MVGFGDPSSSTVLVIARASLGTIHGRPQAAITVHDCRVKNAGKSTKCTKCLGVVYIHQAVKKGES